MADETSLEKDIRRRITLAGPMPVRQFMNLCLTHPEHGYYMTRDPLGRSGDFITAPEVSQVFGELIGLWAAGVWHLLGEPENVRLVELGPGRGTMMLDALRAAKVVPAFRDAVVVHMVEISPLLQARQQQSFAGIDVPVLWHQTFEEVPEGPVIVVANEFFDALAVHQAYKQFNGWYERVVEIDPNGSFAYGIANEPIPLFEQLLPARLRDVPIGSIYEWRTDHLPFELGRRVARGGGAVLAIDYGHIKSDVGDTLQAVGGHAFANPLLAPGTIDLTAHVDFEALAFAAESMGARVFGPIDQGQFLKNLGIDKRAAALKAVVAHEKIAEVDDAVARLTSSDRTGMGRLFKALAFSQPSLDALPAFET